MEHLIFALLCSLAAILNVYLATLAMRLGNYATFALYVFLMVLTLIGAIANFALYKRKG